MNQSLINIMLGQAQEKDKYFQNYLAYARTIKKEVKKILGKTEVLLFGSILKKDETPHDIDLLIISPKLKKSEQKSKIIAKIWQKIGVLSPFELHLVTPDDYQNWYRFFLKGTKVKRV